MKFGIIDLGTNSIRFSIYIVQDNGKISCIFKRKHSLRLGTNVFQTGKLSKDDFCNTRELLLEFKSFTDRNGIEEIFSYATSAMRDAQNSSYFINKIRNETGINLKILSGEQEAHLIAKGILNSVKTPNRYYALVDIGGGSTEISICHRKTVLDSKSINLGAIRIKQIFFPDVPANNSVPNSVIVNARKKIREKIYTELTGMVRPQTESIIGTSGTINAFKKLLKKEGKRIQPFRCSDFQEIIEKLLSLKIKDLLAYPGLESKRADLIQPGGLILQEVIDFLGAQRIYVSNSSLRDGILEAELEKLLRQKVKNAAETTW